MKKLREAPVVDEECAEPVLFSNDASTGTCFSSWSYRMVQDAGPRRAAPARTVGAFASSWHARVLPDFISVVDDPTVDNLPDTDWVEAIRWTMKVCLPLRSLS